MPEAFHGIRVLIVEDELLVSWATQDMLEALGCVTIGPAASVGQALATIASQAVDVAVLDLNLSGALSYPVADCLASRGVPFVFLTGYDRRSIQPDYRAFVALQKPLRRADLVDALTRLLGPSPAPSSGRPLRRG